MKLLGLSGSANSGKDLISDYVSHKYGFVKIAFSDKIKRIIMNLYQFEYNQLWGPSEERGKIDPRYNKVIREFIQGFGDKGRELNIDTWVNYTMEVVGSISEKFGYYYVNHYGLSYDGESSPKNVIISDGRYLNELDAIKQRNGLVIRVVRPNSKISGSVGNHSSETDQNEIPSDFFHYV